METISTTMLIVKTQLKIFTNWFFYEDNQKAIIFSAVLLFFFIVFLFSHDVTTVQTKIVKTLLTIIIPISATNLYLKSISKEKRFLSNFLDKNILSITLQLQAVIVNLIALIILLTIQFSFTKFRNQSPYLISGEILFLVIAGFIQPLFVREKNFKSSGIKKNKLWSYKITNDNLLPVRSIFNRELLFLWRANKNLLLKYLFNFLFINAFFIFFIINNNKADFFPWAFLLQFVFLSGFILNFSNFNNLNLIDYFPHSSFAILKGEFVFWAIVFLLNAVLILVVYGFFIHHINFLLISILFLAMLLLLLYTLLIRLVYADDIATRTLLYLMVFIPVTIPFTVYNCYKKLNAKLL